MKKAVSLLLAVLFAFAGFAAAEEEFTGTWYCTEMSSEGITVDPASFGMTVTLTLNADGTATMDMLGEVSEGSWALTEGKLYLSFGEGTAVEIVNDGSSLTLAENDVSMKFERTAGEAFIRPAEVYAEDIAAFNGSWVPFEFGISGVYVDAETLGLFGLDADMLASLVFTIENGTVNVAGTPVEFSLVDGLLFAEYSTGTESEPESYTVQLLEGDWIEITVPAFNASFICSRAA